MFNNISSDLEFNEFGDISFFGGDIETIDRPEAILRANVMDRIKSNFGDLFLNEDYGADLQSEIGKNNSPLVENTVQYKIKKALTSDGFIPASMLTVLTYRSNEKLFIRISIDAGATVFSSERIIITPVLDLFTGFLNG